jgi:hypothetical protein
MGSGQPNSTYVRLEIRQAEQARILLFVLKCQTAREARIPSCRRDLNAMLRRRVCREQRIAENLDEGYWVGRSRIGFRSPKSE